MRSAPETLGTVLGPWLGCRSTARTTRSTVASVAIKLFCAALAMPRKLLTVLVHANGVIGRFWINAQTRVKKTKTRRQNCRHSVGSTLDIGDMKWPMLAAS